MGFLGIYLARELVNRGEKVVLFQRRSQLPPSARDLEGQVEIVSGDIRHWVDVTGAARKYGVDCVYHNAALLGRDCDASAWNGFEVNMLGTMNILETARIFKIPHVIYLSSGATYGMWNPPRHVNDATPQVQEHMYTTTKVGCERLGEQYHRQYGVNFRGVRPAMVVGPTRQLSYLYGDWSGVIEKTAIQEPYEVHVNPAAPCSYIYVKDVVRAMIELKQAQEAKLRQRVYNVQGFMANITDVIGAVKEKTAPTPG